MILVALGIIFGIILYKWCGRQFDNETDRVSFLPGLLLLTGTLVFILAGLFGPLAGYEEPKLLETRALYPITSTALVESTGQDTYLVIDMKNDRKSDNEYWYCVENNGKKRTEREYGDVRVSYEETDTPIIESYVRKAKKTPFSLNIATTEKYYVVVAPQSGVQLKQN